MYHALVRLWVILCCASAVLVASETPLGHEVKLERTTSQMRLSAGRQTWQFTQVAGLWALDVIEVAGKPVAVSLARQDSFYVGGGEAASATVLSDTPDTKSIRFALDENSATFSVDRHDRLPVVHVLLESPTSATCTYRTAADNMAEHGAWVTRGWVATDADGQEAFIDASNPLVFGHSQAGDVDTGYLFLPVVKGHIQRNGRTEQRTDTWFKGSRLDTGDGRFCGSWQIRMGAQEPKQFAMLFDRDLGGRLSDVCEKYYADAVDSLVDVTTIPQTHDPERCLQMLPVRLAAPDAFIPGWGWMMDEFPKASYPFGHDAVWQQPALLAFEGLATQRDWERNFARYLLDKTPLEGQDGKSFFVRRPGGLTRWGYFATYRDGFPHLDGGTWWQADLLYRTALALDDNRLRQAAVDMVLHDLNVKLDLEKMRYPPCWSAIDNHIGKDHRDDWFQTPGLAYCAYMAATVAYPATKDPAYLTKADRICEWFAGFLAPEAKLNFLQDNNMHAVFSHYLQLAFLDKYERSRDRRFLDMARDMAWVHIMTLCTTNAKDRGGHPLTGTTCVGVRGCVDYDCAPNLCHEKDLTFVHTVGPLLDHVSGPAYAKYLTLHRLVLAKDSWPSAWVTELRDTNLRTMYDTYARGMANLIYALNTSGDPWVVAVDKLVSKSDTSITQRRDFVLANGTIQDRRTRLQARFLKPGVYDLLMDGVSQGHRTDRELSDGIEVSVPANSMKRVNVCAVSLEERVVPNQDYAASVTYLSDLIPYAAQRGTGLPEPTFRNDRSFGGRTIRLGSQDYTKGLGCAANTVLLYRLDGNYERFRATVGVDQEMAGMTQPPPSVFFTVHVDGMLRFESGPMYQDTAPRKVNVDVRHAQMLMLRLSCNWDDNGNSIHDLGDWAEARLVGRARP